MKLLTTSMKILFVFCFVLSIIFFIMAYNKSSVIIQDSFSQQIDNHLSFIQKQLQQFQSNRYSLLKTLSDDRRTKLFLKTKNFNDINSFFISFAKADLLINQMRILDLQGNEIFRLNQKNKEITVVPKTQLQNKAHRYYFQQALELKNNELGISKLDLNVENKKIEQPFNATVRLSMPIILNDNKAGVVIINYKMNSFVNSIFSSAFFDIYLVDSLGYFITHDKKEYQWSQYTNKVKYVSYFEPNTLNQLTIKKVDLWGNTYGLLYNAKENSSAKKFINDSQSIGLFIFFASIILVLPFSYLLFIYLKQLRKTNNHISDTKNQMEAILNHTSDAIILINKHAIIHEVNDSVLKTFGYSREELLGKNINILVPEPHHSKHDEYVQNYDKSMKSKIINKNRELFGLHKNKTFIPINLTVTHVFIDEQEYFIGTIQNLSNEKISKKLFENIFNSASIGMALVLKEGQLWRVNKTFCDILEYSEEELLNMTFQDFTHHEDLDNDLKQVTKILNKQIDNYSLNKRYITKSGKIVWVRLTVTGVFADNSKELFEYFIATVDDITEQMLIEQKLKEAEEIAQIGHWNWNIEFDKLTWSDNMMKLFGKTKETFKNSYDDFILTVVEDDREFVNKKVQETLENNIPFMITYRIEVNEQIKHIQAKGKVTYKDEKPIEFFGTCQDITSLKKLEEEKKQKDMLLMQQSKQASMGEMVGAIAHQWRQPLNSIGYIIQDLLSAYKHNEFSEEYLIEIKKEVMEQLKYMSDTIDEFRTFFKKDEPYKRFNLIDTITEVHRLYRAQLNNNALKLLFMVNEQNFNTLSQAEKASFEIKSQEGQLKQVLINCISNVKDALDGKSALKEQEKEILVELIEKESFYKIYIHDLAGGIDNKTAQRIFEPYFTTKDMGTGLGLYICKTVCEKSLNATIEYRPRKLFVGQEILKGSTFIISLPKGI